MKKLIFSFLAIVMVSSLSFGQRINKPKAGFMAVGDVIAGSACVALGPYGVLWGGFIGSCGAAVLWNDMNAGRLAAPTVRNNPDSFFDQYALVGKYHNELMIKYYNDYDKNPVFKGTDPSSYIKNQMLQSKHFDATSKTKESFVENLSIYDNLFVQMEEKRTISVMLDELNKINKATADEQVFYNRIIDFTLQEEPRRTPEEIFSFVDEMEREVKSSKLSQNSKEELYYSLEILRYSYALWHKNVQE